MKLRAEKLSDRDAAGIMLVECLVYLAVLFLVLCRAYSVFYRGWEQSLGLRRNTEQIARALTTGERWREDVRTATGPLRAEESATEQFLHIPHGAGEVSRRFTPPRSHVPRSAWDRKSGRSASLPMRGLGASFCRTVL